MAAADKGLERRGGLRSVDMRHDAWPVANWPGNRFRGRAALGLLIDLPFAISPVVVGLMLVLVYGKAGWLGSWLAS